MHYNEVFENHRRKNYSEVIYLNISKAYDKVDHCILIRKMKAMGVRGLLGQWLGSFLLERTQCVKIGDTVSKKENIISGVPQGSVLGPIMFLIFISNIGHNSSAMSQIYVDDSKVAMNVIDESLERILTCTAKFQRIKESDLESVKEN